MADVYAVVALIQRQSIRPGLEDMDVELHSVWINRRKAEAEAMRLQADWLYRRSAEQAWLGELEKARNAVIKALEDEGRPYDSESIAEVNERARYLAEAAAGPRPFNTDVDNIIFMVGKGPLVEQS